MGVTVGCDPEFVLFDKERDALVSTRDLYLPARNTKKLAVVHDQNACEFRPRYSSIPREVAKSLGEMLKEWRKLSSDKRLKPNFLVATGSHCEIPPSQCLGGHIHVGTLPPYLLMTPEPKRRDPYAFIAYEKTHLSIYQKRLFLGISYLWILEDPERMWSRRQHATGEGYGTLYANRGLPGGHGTIEIRHPSSDWASHPELMTLALSLAAHIADADPRTASGKEIMEVEGEHNAMMKHAQAARTEALPGYLKSVHHLIREIVPEDILKGIKDWSKELKRRRNKYGVSPILEEEWK